MCSWSSWTNLARMYAKRQQKRHTKDLWRNRSSDLFFHAFCKKKCWKLSQPLRGSTIGVQFGVFRLQMSAKNWVWHRGEKENTLVRVCILQVTIGICYCADWIKVQGVQFSWLSQRDARIVTPRENTLKEPRCRHISFSATGVLGYSGFACCIMLTSSHICFTLQQTILYRVS